MKKLILCLSLFCAPALFAANPSVWRSSYTASADTTQNLCMNKRGFLHAVVVSSASANATVSVYASSATANSIMTLVDASNEGYFPYDTIAIATNTAHTGLTYSTVGTASVQILYDCF